MFLDGGVWIPILVHRLAISFCFLSHIGKLCCEFHNAGCQADTVSRLEISRTHGI
jgi:hypothetical protein